MSVAIVGDSTVSISDIDEAFDSGMLLAVAGTRGVLNGFVVSLTYLPEKNIYRIRWALGKDYFTSSKEKAVKIYNDTFK